MGGKPSLTGNKLEGTGGKSSAKDSSSGTFSFSSVLSPIGGGGGKPSLTCDKLGGTGGKSSANDSSSGTFSFSSVLSLSVVVVSLHYWR